MNSRVSLTCIVSGLLLIAGCGGVGGSSGITVSDHTLGEAACDSGLTSETMIEKQTSGENTTLVFTGAVSVNGDYYELKPPELRHTSGDEYELYIDSSRASERTEVCSAHIPYTVTLNLGPNDGDSSKMTLYHDGNVQAKILLDELKKGVPVVFGS